MISEEEIKNIDKEDMLGSISTLQRQVNGGLKLASEIRIPEEVDDIIVAGMGGSALPGEVLKSLLIDSKIRVTVCKDYKLPAWAGKKTLVFVISYSGNTEETIASYRDALKKNCQVIAIASGGKLQQLARKQETPFIKVPKPFDEFQPRAAIGYLFFSMLGVLIKSRLIPDMANDIAKTEKALQPEKYIDKAKDLAEQLASKVPLIYTSEKLAAAGYKWKIAFNENTKLHAFCNVYPEMNHNEMNAFENLEADFHVIMLSNDDDHPQVRKRMKITKELYQKRSVPVTEMAMKGDSLLAKLFTAILIGDLVAFYLAVRYRIDPTPVAMVEDLKKQL